MRNISSLFVVGLISYVFLTWLYNNQLGSEHKELITNLSWVSLTLLSIGTARTISFWSNKAIGFGTLFICAAAFAHHFNWNIGDTSGYGLFCALAIFCTLSGIFRNFLPFSCWYFAAFFAMQPYLYFKSDDWHNFFHESILKASLASLFCIVVSVSFILTGYFFWRRQKAAPRQAVWRWNRGK